MYMSISLNNIPSAERILRHIVRDCEIPQLIQIHWHDLHVENTFEHIWSLVLLNLRKEEYRSGRIQKNSRVRPDIL